MSEDGHSWVKSKELLDRTITSTEEKITDEGLKRSAAKYYPEKTVLVAMYGANVGQLGWLGCRATVNQAICGLVADESQAHWRYLFYSLFLHRDKLITKAQGAAQQNLNQDAIRTFELPFPDLPTQKKIAGILSAYDDLIENNLRRITILEEMAQSLYREWFVHFRIPSEVLIQAGLSPEIKLVDSELGKIPEGWEVKKLRDVTSKIGSGATPTGGKDAYKSEGISLIRSMNIFDYQFKHANLAYIDEKQAAKLSNVTVKANDVLLNITGASVARCSMVPSAVLPARVNQHVAIIRASTERDSFYILDTINSEERKRQILSLAQGGATREALTKTTIENLEIMMPSEQVLQVFSKIRKPLFDESQILDQKNQNLRKTRDLLLPKLLK